MDNYNLTNPTYVSKLIDFSTENSIDNFLHDFKKAISENNLVISLYTMTHRQFIEIVSNWTEAPVIDNFATSIIRKYTNLDYTPRSYHYSNSNDLDYTGEYINDRARFYCFNKIHSFLTIPFRYFRIPFSIGLNNDTIYIHPGNFRFMAMKFLPKDSICSVMVTNVDKNRELIEYINKTKNYITNQLVSEYTDSELVKILRVADYKHASIQISSASGLQIYEHHPALKEYEQEYTISLNNINEYNKYRESCNKEIVVNNIRVATLVDLGVDTRWVLPDKQVL